MLVEPAVTKVTDATITTPTAVGGTIKDPKTRSARSMVRIRSGDTLVLGGLIDRTEEKIVRKVPILGDIPVLGEVFKDTHTNNSATELLVFLTPRILEEAPARAAAAAGASPTSSWPREQETIAGHEDVIEQTLNTAEHSKL